MKKEIGIIWYNEDTDKVEISVDAKFLIAKFGPMLVSKVNLSELLFGKK